ncbi:hypothetical protein [Alkalibacillus almallahensis]|uniref:hypothetical protein n=1 Tax=Alkalibacillus almallahensis TaxID=1379154 RepID=UPI0014235FD3|nr:hypothetical protein [Alkalibacillus almallahensis]NIK10892.1 hypothetical protein [Alkalibacillus almallahensis]
MPKEYAVYQGDDLLVMGTKEECAEELGITPDSVKWLATAYNVRRVEKLTRPKLAKVAVSIDLKELEEDDLASYQ